MQETRTGEGHADKRTVEGLQGGLGKGLRRVRGRGVRKGTEQVSICKKQGRGEGHTDTELMEVDQKRLGGLW